MDELDRAKMLEMQQREQSLARVLNRPQHHPGEIAEYDENGNRVCVDCGDMIHPERLKIVPSAIRCIDCKQIWEQKYL